MSVRTAVSFDVVVTVWHDADRSKETALADMRWALLKSLDNSPHVMGYDFKPVTD